MCEVNSLGNKTINDSLDCNAKLSVSIFSLTIAVFLAVTYPGIAVVVVDDVLDVDSLAQPVRHAPHGRRAGHP